jgi:selenocysteine lyase/cysteine desulfurase
VEAAQRARGWVEATIAHHHVRVEHVGFELVHSPDCGERARSSGIGSGVMSTTPGISVCTKITANKSWYAGGTTILSSVATAEDEGDGYYMAPGVARFEDGTLNYLTIPAVEIGRDWIESIGIDTINRRTELLTGWLLEQVQQLRHANRSPVVRLHGPRDMRDRGATVALNMLDPTGAVWSCWHVESLANERRLSVRAGCHCNPGAREVALGYSHQVLAACFKDKDRRSFEECARVARDWRDGVVRVSLGLASTFKDVERFVAFARTFVDQPAPLDKRATFSPGVAHAGRGEALLV